MLIKVIRLNIMTWYYRKYPQALKIIYQRYLFAADLFYNIYEKKEISNTFLWYRGYLR